jgi:hypothetical protein
VRCILSARFHSAPFSLPVIFLWHVKYALYHARCAVYKSFADVPESSGNFLGYVRFENINNWFCVFGKP